MFFLVPTIHLEGKRAIGDLIVPIIIDLRIENGFRRGAQAHSV